MLNIISLLGPSRCGKGAIIPIVAAVDNFELPYNTPDLDWYVDAHNLGDISSDALCRLSANYLLCYSWYGHLGRHINLRKDDYYSLQRMKPNIDLQKRHDKKDKDYEFLNFINDNDSKKIWNIFQWDLSPEIFEEYEKKYPINTNPIYCYRSPYYLFTSWISSNRVKRSRSFSRMFKYDSTFYLKKDNLLSQFENAKNDNEVDFIKELGTYKYKEFNFDKTKIDTVEEDRLIKLLIENKDNATYWSKINMMFRFEKIVSDPDSFVNYLIKRFNVKFDEESLKKGILLMDKRPIEKIIELDIYKIKTTLKNLGCKEKVIDFIVNEQKKYIESL